MSKFITKWDTAAEYNAVKNNLAKPQVALVKETMELDYEPYVDPYAGHEYVDLGLPSGTKWATMNIGASSETDYGNYYQYGKGADQYAATSGQSDYSGTENPLATSADTAAQTWGGSWHMPTKAQFEELTANTTYQWVTDFNGSGIDGGKFTSNTDSSKYVFFPAAGRWYDGQCYSGGNYWSSSPSGSSVSYDLVFFFGGKGIYDSNRKGGYSVRGVVDA